jgi:hypothetical protein
MRLTPTAYGENFETCELLFSEPATRPAEVSLPQNWHPRSGNPAPGAGRSLEGSRRMIPLPPSFSTAVKDASDMCGAVAIDYDFADDVYAFIWCGPGVVVGIEVTPEMTVDDVFNETLVMISLSDDPEFNVAADDEHTDDFPINDFPQVGDLTPAQRAQTDTWVGVEDAVMIANPQRFRH